jgi:hypothetical protein
MPKKCCRCLPGSSSGVVGEPPVQRTIGETTDSWKERNERRNVTENDKRWKKFILDSVSNLDRLQPDMRKKIYDEITRHTGGKSVKKSNWHKKQLTKTRKC